MPSCTANKRDQKVQGTGGSAEVEHSIGMEIVVRCPHPPDALLLYLFLIPPLCRYLASHLQLLFLVWLLSCGCSPRSPVKLDM